MVRRRVLRLLYLPILADCYLFKCVKLLFKGNEGGKGSEGMPFVRGVGASHLNHGNQGVGASHLNHGN